VPFILKGAVLGLLIAAPVGPMGLLCISRTLRAGWIAGFAGGLGVATADAAYAFVAAFGVRAIVDVVAAAALPLHLAGAIVLCFLGLRTLHLRPVTDSPAPSTSGIGSAYITTLLLTIVNPATIVSFLALFGSTLGAHRPAANAGRLVAGVFLGSALWWLLLATVVGVSRRAFGTAILHRINAFSGLVLFAFGAYTFAGAWAP